MPIGEIAGPFGIRGEAKVNMLTDFPERFSGLTRVFVGPRHDELEIEETRLHKGQALVRFAGVTTPEQVDKLRGAEIVVPRSEAVELPADHYFLSDLLGAEVRTTDGQELGHIADILQTAGNDVYVVRGTGREILVPAIREAIDDLDVAAGRVIVEPWVLESV
ncbi:MAG TPA: ribosome maturation factor RimM [Chloroflexota bacterium]|nr:ribosome maturation factor RimM [Chloroflexota bacterium]